MQRADVGIFLYKVRKGDYMIIDFGILALIQFYFYA